MFTLPELKPTKKPRVFDLVREAGIDVSDWANYERPENPAANPRYCYSWSFIRPGVLVVLNLRFNSMVEANGEILQHLKFRTLAALDEESAARKARRRHLEEAVALAYRSSLPVRVIVLDGQSPAVSARLLDPIPWAVISYNETTGEAIVRRGAAPSAYTDQFSLPNPPDGASGTRNVMTTIRDRNRAVRDFVLSRAKGSCELCGVPGFQLPDGSKYLETHHVVSLAEDGADSASNVVALCPNHHREAHHGRDAKGIRERLLDILNSGKQTRQAKNR